MALSRQKTLSIDLRWIDSSGVGVYIKGILPGLVERLKDFAIIGIGNCDRLGQFSWSRAENVRLVDCRASRYSMVEQLQLLKAIPSETDLFFSPYYTIPLFYRGRIAVTVHDMSHLLIRELVKDARKRIYAKVMFKTIRRRASLIFTVSDFTKSELLRLTHGPHDNNIVPTHLGISPEWSSASQLPAVRGGRYLIAVGNVKPYKNFGRLVDAFQRIRDKIPHDLVIVGQSEGLITGESAEFFELIRESGDRVHLTGYVSFPDLKSLVGHAEALVMPSLYEGFGLPPLEAMAAGVPVVTSTSASLPEVCCDAALYFDPMNVEDMANKLLTVASNLEVRKELGRRGKERSRMFTWELCSQKTADALRGCL
jgi:glycosyltransferase involved in cell wall biosynthesis